MGVIAGGVTGAMLRVLEGFHHRVTRRILAVSAQRAGEVGREWSPVEEALKVSGVCPIK